MKAPDDVAIKRTSSQSIPDDSSDKITALLCLVTDGQDGLSLCGYVQRFIAQCRKLIACRVPFF